MSPSRRVACLLAAGLFLAGGAAAQEAVKSPAKPFEPYHGQPGRDVVWVPTPPTLVEKMLDMAKVTASDFVMDLGSGDGRNIIAAAKRGAKAVGVEFNPDMVALSRRNAAGAGVAGKASFVEGDMYKADVSQASVLALFLLTENMDKMVDKFLAMRPGSRIVVNGFRISGWKEDETGMATGDCHQWCTAYLYIVPARVDGAWRLADGELTLEQKYQTFTGSLLSGGERRTIEDGRLHGDRISFRIGGREYEGRVNGNAMSGAVKVNESGAVKGGGPQAWNAARK